MMFNFKDPRSFARCKFGPGLAVTIHVSFAAFFVFISFIGKAQTNSNQNTEITNERGMYTKVFLKTNGEHEAVLSSSPVHYKKNGSWEEINTMLIPVKGGYKNETNVIRSYFPVSNSSSDKIKLILDQGNELFIHAEKELLVLTGQNVISSIPANPNNSIANVSGGFISYPDIYENISDEFSVKNGEIKNTIILNALPHALKKVSSGYLGIRETLELPAGWKITSIDNNTLTASSLLISDAQNNPVLSIPEPVFFDSYGLRSDGSGMVEGKYLIAQENDHWTITTLVPVTWLKDPNTKYPVSIDPTVIIAGTTGGWQSPNNFVDNPGFVFIGVCCSNLTHRAWIKFNIAGIPSTSCITNVEIQPNVTSVANTIAEAVLINDVTGAFGPYGGINAAAYNDFGTGNYTSFTITTTGLYGYYSLGASANTLLQSQIPGGWFQVAFQFVNEPSTNYKIITATSSNLRVTYAAPPCVVLPIELLSFDSKCNNGKVDLSWETALERNNDHFTVERTKDGINYETVGTVAGAVNSNENLRYTFVDDNPLKGTSYYSLKQTDRNGNSEALKLVAVNCGHVKELAVSPNPNTGAFTLEGAGQNDEIIITDMYGQIVFQTKITGEKTQIDLSRHVNGIYFIRTVSEKGSELKKMIISK
jgi:hypothetical protein